MEQDNRDLGLIQLAAKLYRGEAPALRGAQLNAQMGSAYGGAPSLAQPAPVQVRRAPATTLKPFVATQEAQDASLREALARRAAAMQQQEAAPSLAAPAVPQEQVDEVLRKTLHHIRG